MTDDPYRLPRTVLPRRYDVDITPDLAAASFEGTVTIAVEVTEPTDRIVLNAAELNIGAASVDGAPVLAVEPDEATERVTLRLAAPLEAGSHHEVTLGFTGVLNDKLRGFYRSTYTADDGTTRVIACSQMQATDCRRAFPCFDEPDFKAVFGVTLRVAEGLTAISNGAEVSRTPTGDGRVAVRFADTMPMSTYLVAFVVGELEATDPVDVDGVPLRVVHVPGRSHLAAFALDCGAFCLRWFVDYYGIPYPGQKVDLVALPDFAAGAMENLGCITFREALLLVDPASATQQEEQLVADVIAHELAHMWFGDLVTMKWWNGIWLNEAFATFMEIKACDAYRPEWERWTSFGLSRTAAFDADSLRSTRPIEYPVVSPADADGMFDVLTYEKGGALLRMLEQYLGEDRFRDGIRHYLTTHRFGNTETSDLWDALEQATGAPVRRIMDSWIWQGGHPVVRATVDDGNVVLTQARFYADGGGPDPGEPASTVWSVPLHLGAAPVLLEGEPLRVPDTGGVLVLNRGATGFFRSSYDDTLRHRLSGPALAELTALERYQLVDDTWAAVVAGQLDTPAFCEFARAFGDDTDLAVWQILLTGLGWCDRLVDGQAREGFRAYVRALIGPALHRLGWAPADGESDLTRELRGTLLRALGVLGADVDARHHAATVYAAAVEAGEPADPALVNAAVAVVASTGDDARYEQYLERFRAATTPQEQLRFLYNLAEFPDAAHMERTLALSVSTEVRTQNAPFLLQRCLRHREYGAVAWRFIRDRWSELNDRFPANSIVRMIEGVKTLTRPEELADVAGFFADHDIPQARKTLQQILERQRINAAFRQREADRLAVRFG